MRFQNVKRETKLSSNHPYYRLNWGIVFSGQEIQVHNKMNMKCIHCKLLQRI